LFDPGGCGWFVERWRLAAGLREAAVAAGARLRRAWVRGVVPGDRRAPGLVLDDGAAVRPGWVVDASGRRAVGGRRLGARRVQHDRLVGLCRRYDADPDPATLVEAVPDGWWFSAPVATGLITIRFGDADLTDWRRADDDPPPHTRARVAAAGRAERPVLVAASTSRLRPITGPRWVAVGDAAATPDPLSSSGLLHGLSSARAAVAAIVGDDLPAYDRQERERFDEHLRQRRAHYDVERRFSDAEFWRRRRIREAQAAGHPGR
jgi:flavin-dependent dehydrogenase